MASKFSEAKAQYEVATARYQLAIRQGSTEEMILSLDAQDKAFIELAHASAGRLQQLQRAVKRYAEAA